MFSVNPRLVSDKSAEGIAQEVQRQIGSGELPGGSRLPPVRQIAAEIGVSPSTVGQAWRLLAEHGVIETRGRLGTFVTEFDKWQPWRQFRSVTGVDPEYDLSTGFPDTALLPDLGPFLRAIIDSGWHLGYDAAVALPTLRDELEKDVQTEVTADNVLLASHVIGLLGEVFPVVGGFRSGVIVSNPEFAPYLDLLERAGLRACPVELDDEGPRIDDVQREIDAGASAIILQPRVHNPTGTVMSRDRLRGIALLCAEHDVAIIESDYFGRLSSSPPITAGHWAPEQTLYIRSYSKDIHPDIRVVAAIGSRRIVQRVQRRRVGGYDVSGLNQELLRRCLESADIRAHTRSAKAEYDRRRKAFIDELARHGIEVLSKDGFNVWVPVESEQNALLHLAYNGISAAPGSAFQLLPNGQFVRVSIASMNDRAVEIGQRVAAAACASRAKG